MWVWVWLVWLVMFVIKLVSLRLGSLKLMWVFPVTFFAMLPWYAHESSAAREAGDQLVQQVEQYHQAHGAYPPDEKVLGYTRKGSFAPSYVYNAEGKKPFVGYHDFVTFFGSYYYDFDSKTWKYSG
jgi:hypothetical protein